jgi:hypothetical protein
MPGIFLLSSAYFPPVSYISLVHSADKIWLEKEENYIKQTYRNRCRILSANGPVILTVPVLSSASSKTCIKDVRIDYSKRWQQIHIRAIKSAYSSSAFFEYYFDLAEKLINSRENYLLDLNDRSLEMVMKIAGISTPVEYTSGFSPVRGEDFDFRYSISPKKETPETYSLREYFQVFGNKYGFVPDLSVLDLIFNTGPDAIHYMTSGLA